MAVGVGLCGFRRGRCAVLRVEGVVREVHAEPGPQVPRTAGARGVVEGEEELAAVGRDVAPADLWVVVRPSAARVPLVVRVARVAGPGPAAAARGRRRRRAA